MTHSLEGDAVERRRRSTLSWRQRPCRRSFRKVAEAKRLLETGEKTTVNGAAREVGISRSAFYKYKDAVHPFQRYAPRAGSSRFQIRTAG